MLERYPRVKEVAVTRETLVERSKEPNVVMTGIREDGVYYVGVCLDQAKTFCEGCAMKSGCQASLGKERQRG